MWNGIGDVYVRVDAAANGKESLMRFIDGVASTLLVIVAICFAAWGYGELSGDCKSVLGCERDEFDIAMMLVGGIAILGVAAGIADAALRARRSRSEAEIRSEFDKRHWERYLSDEKRPSDSTRYPANTPGPARLLRDFAKILATIIALVLLIAWLAGGAGGG